MVRHVRGEGGYSFVAVLDGCGVGWGSVHDVMVAYKLEEGLALLVCLLHVALVKSGAGLGDNADAFRLADGQSGDVDVYDAAWSDGHKLLEDFEAVAGGLIEVSGDARRLDCAAHSDCGDAEECAFHCRSDSAGVIDVDSDVRTVVYS